MSRELERHPIVHLGNRLLKGSQRRNFGLHLGESNRHVELQVRMYAGMLGCEEYTETPVKFAVVIPEPASAEVTSSSVLSTGALTTTVKTIWSGDRLALLEAVTVTLFESSCPNASDGDITNANNKKPLSMAEVLPLRGRRQAARGTMELSSLPPARW